MFIFDQVNSGLNFLPFSGKTHLLLEPHLARPARVAEIQSTGPEDRKSSAYRALPRLWAGLRMPNGGRYRCSEIF